ncbi:protein phosphatase 2C 51 [Pyrus ussuriensis x Pyrus communis]|uniref:protein-serine/threonine phosphatase n=1 Tax=Pyrus ussuriensis x Pyrus communis TaxID=2448454 RepID=A0A5N5F772_9ROSA|nr:protein phosphatase 2C 51 [Pyrus ussuriensis x Pyrus communis]
MYLIFLDTATWIWIVFMDNCSRISMTRFVCSLVISYFCFEARLRPSAFSSNLKEALHLQVGGMNGKMRPQSFVIETKNARRQRLRVRRLKYTCQAKKIQVQITGGSGQKHASEDCKTLELKEREKDVGSSMEILSVSFSASKNDVVLSSGSVTGSDEGGEKRSGEGSEERGGCGIVSVKGMRKEMEDAVTAEVGFGKFDFYGVYDGHGGPDVAGACRERMHEVVAEAVEKEGTKGDAIDWETVMEGCFEKMDGEVSDIAAARTVGATAVVALVTEEQVVVANCGDSRAVLSRGGVALALSNDHKPDRVDELKRIEAAGGRVINWNGSRVLGVLATSRSIGDNNKTLSH